MDNTTIALGIIILTLLGALIYCEVTKKAKASVSLTNKPLVSGSDIKSDDKKDAAIPIGNQSPDGTEDVVAAAHKKSGMFAQQGDTIAARGLRKSSGSFDLPAFLCGTGPAAPKCVQLSHCPGDF